MTYAKNVAKELRQLADQLDTDIHDPETIIGTVDQELIMHITNDMIAFCVLKEVSKNFPEQCNQYRAERVDLDQLCDAFC